MLITSEELFTLEFHIQLKSSTKRLVAVEEMGCQLHQWCILILMIFLPHVIFHPIWKNLLHQMCKREKILSYFGYTVPVRTPDHLCCDFHEQRCRCYDCLLSSASSMFERNAISDKDKSTPTCGSEALTDTPHTTALSSEQKANLIERLVNYRHSLHGSGKSCVGSVSLCTGFSIALINLVVEHASELSSIEEVKSKLPIYDNDHAVVIFQILNTVRTVSV